MEREEKLISLPRLNLSDRQLFDLELILNGGFYPLKGFLGEADYFSVLQKMRLGDGALWPMPVVLDVFPDFKHQAGGEVILCDRYGNPLAFLEIDSVYQPDKKAEAEMIYQTTSPHHPGVRYLFRETGGRYVGGKVLGISFSPKYDFTHLRYHPDELKNWFAANGWDKVIAFQTRNPIHRAHYELMRRTAEEKGGKILIHPVVGVTKDGDIDYPARVRAYEQVYDRYMKNFAKLALLPLAMRMAGPREAVWHALIRKNYGCSHLIVGRDHAGPGKDEHGRPFYGEYEAQALAKKYEREIGLEIIPQEEMVYVEEFEHYRPRSSVPPGAATRSISGTELRRRLLAGEEIPSWFSFPEALAELKEAAVAGRGGLVVFLTGLPSSGKSTVAHVLYHKLLEKQRQRITLLDGDVVRNYLSRGLGFSRQDRNANIERIGFVANEIARHGGICICAAIAPYEEARDRNRRLISRQGVYLEVYLATPLEICRQRDAKGLYRKAASGQLKHLTGVDDPYEVPVNPEIVMSTEDKTPTECADQIIDFIKQRQLLALD